MSQNPNEQAPVPTPEEIKHALETEERFVNYFQGFLPSSVSMFITSYAQYKREWLQYGERCRQYLEGEATQWIDEAWLHLGIIAQKKLFDLQCLWRAEKISIPEIRICHEFQMWAEHVLDCPFIEPVNEDDVALYIQYLHTENVDLDVDHISGYYQDYGHLKDAYNNQDSTNELPEWYDFHMSRTGTGVYLTFPDIRWQKELHYIHLAAEARKKELNEPEPVPYVPDNRPFLNFYDKEQLDYFVKTFESREVFSLYEAFTERMERINNAESYLEIVKTLLNVGEPVPMYAHQDFAAGIINCYNRYKVRKIIEFLPVVLEQYQMNRALNIPNAEQPDSHYDDIFKLYADAILRGRKAAGEPEDFNF